MKTISLKITALALMGALALASSAHAGGLYDDDDDNGASSQYNRKSISRYCYENPYADACDPYGKKQYRQKSYNNSYNNGNSYNSNGRCAALIRAVGKRNLVTAFARNSARFAWAREARAVHGQQYSNWGNARNANISCDYVGGLKSCIATATPCRG